MTAAGSPGRNVRRYIAAMAELEGIIATIQANYWAVGRTVVMAHQPMLLWLADVAAKSAFTAASHAEIVAAYEGAVVAMPTLGELFENHFVNGVLNATNFFGVNTIPIGLNEMDTSGCGSWPPCDARLGRRLDRLSERDPPHADVAADADARRR